AIQTRDASDRSNRMARKSALCRASNGLFVRNLGWKRTPTGFAQHKFYLGRDEPAAGLASLRLERLWEQVCKRWERERPFAADLSRPVGLQITVTSLGPPGQQVGLDQAGRLVQEHALPSGC